MQKIIIFLLFFIVVCNLSSKSLTNALAKTHKTSSRTRVQQKPGPVNQQRPKPKTQPKQQPRQQLKPSSMNRQRQ